MGGAVMPCMLGMKAGPKYMRLGSGKHWAAEGWWGRGWYGEGWAPIAGGPAGERNSSRCCPGLAALE
ncbi:hypothetical protein CEXT_443841 [Caerostris extrusa]|uniref:Uncharacterized protein n=1 Tax=Caerostris extrusa TaxID=172846 RepID=A0AAV4N5I2_CAEEX|nr:hypothetical protein CEXT_443841 [Caerostris extrusa]